MKRIIAILSAVILAAAISIFAGGTSPATASGCGSIYNAGPQTMSIATNYSGNGQLASNARIFSLAPGQKIGGCSLDIDAFWYGAGACYSIWQPGFTSTLWIHARTSQWYKVNDFGANIGRWPGTKC